ncbi:hypothetical protein BC939DRAFT_81744 [Gamsiella multidivaricata]|uniref:uncharacterized protein n=1 Tax=Gamsiella multidivaricata TaxID=101098 RepID=UPI0022205741|nr:uncharacterized protein BC939DRAFT_81744 [Gamsiella multidivaricata]KAI7815837.1 hypothetical protein BC939DRAFT_81744 [Gamsiella multidivaricata]
MTKPDRDKTATTKTAAAGQNRQTDRQTGCSSLCIYFFIFTLSFFFFFTPPLLLCFSCPSLSTPPPFLSHILPHSPTLSHTLPYSHSHSHALSLLLFHLPPLLPFRFPTVRLHICHRVPPLPSNGGLSYFIPLSPITASKYHCASAPLDIKPR